MHVIYYCPLYNERFAAGLGRYRWRCVRVRRTDPACVRGERCDVFTVETGRPLITILNTRRTYDDVCTRVLGTREIRDVRKRPREPRRFDGRRRQSLCGRLASCYFNVTLKLKTARDIAATGLACYI